MICLCPQGVPREYVRLFPEDAPTGPGTARRLLAPLSINEVVCAFDPFRFPDGYLTWMDLVLLGDVGDGLVAPDRLHGDPGLEFGSIDRSVLSHGYLPYYCNLHVGRNPPYSTVQFSGGTIIVSCTSSESILVPIEMRSQHLRDWTQYRGNQVLPSRAEETSAEQETLSSERSSPWLV